MEFSDLRPMHTGAAASAGMGTMNHLHSKQMGFAAAQRLQMAKAMGSPRGGVANMGGPAPVNPIRPPTAPGGPAAPGAPPAPGGDFRQHVAAATGLPGVSVPEVHQAIGAMAQMGQINPFQAHALVAHRGPLAGPAGAQTVGKIANTVKLMRARRGGAGMAPPPNPGPMAPPMAPRPPMGMPGQGGIANGGMPAGMGQ